MADIHFAASDLLALLDTVKPYRTVLEHGEIAAVIYAPKDVDRQRAHPQAEIYIVIRGNGRIQIGHRVIAFGPGDLLFVDTGLKHRFVDFSPDLAVWAVFFGPSIVGSHTFETVTNSGQTLSGDVTISQSQDTFGAQWSSGADTMTGVGFAREGRLAFARALDPTSKPGIVEYRWENDTLLARWALPELLSGTIGLGRGTLVEGDGRQFSGRFQIQYQDSTGTDVGPTYDLSIVHEGPVRSLRWHASAAPALVGIGLETEGRLIAAWGPNGSGLGLVDYASPVSGASPILSGRSIRFGQTQPEIERIELQRRG